MFGIGRSSGGLTEKTEKKILDDATPPIKRFQYLSKFTENSSETEVRPFYSTNYSKIYKIFLDALLALDSQAKTARSTCVVVFCLLFFVCCVCCVTFFIILIVDLFASFSPILLCEHNWAHSTKQLAKMALQRHLLICGWCSSHMTKYFFLDDSLHEQFIVPNWLFLMSFDITFSIDWLDWKWKIAKNHIMHVSTIINIIIWKFMKIRQNDCHVGHFITGHHTAQPVQTCKEHYSEKVATEIHHTLPGVLPQWEQRFCSQEEGHGAVVALPRHYARRCRYQGDWSVDECTQVWTICRGICKITNLWGER